MGVKRKGLFITFEGAEGSGKSTQIEYARQFFKEKHKSVVLLREPGGVKISERIRGLLLDVRNKEMSVECETLLYMAARAQLVKEVLKPALSKGWIVLCDRFLDSTVVYQGYGSGVDVKMIQEIGEFAVGGIKPNLTFIFDIDAKEGLGRIHRKKDRIEQRALDFHQRVRRGYLALAKQEPKRIKLISGNRTKEEIRFIVNDCIKELLG